MLEYMDRNHFVEVEKRQMLDQPHESTLKHLGAVIFKGCEAVVDSGLNIIVKGTDFNPRIS